MTNVTIQIPRDLVPFVRTALEARAGEFEKAGRNVWHVEYTARKWRETAARLRELVKNLK